LALPTKKLFLGLVYAKTNSMIRKTVLLVLPLLVSIAGFSQSGESSKKTARPDIPGTFVVEFGLNRDLGAATNFSLFLWGSRTLNLYYQYDIRLFKSKFSVVPGIGLSLERYSFKRVRRFHFNEKRDSLYLIHRGESPGIHLDTLSLKKSRLITNYVEMPIEFRYTSKPEDPAHAFKIGVGARVGYLFDSFSKLKFHQDGQNKILKDKQDFFLNKFRYGVFAKVGIGNFSLFAYYNMNTLFQKNKSPFARDTPTLTYFNKDFSTMTVGISLASF
jgi:hypothetical protein